MHHILHHRHTNDPERDPDHWQIRGAFRTLALRVPAGEREARRIYHYKASRVGDWLKARYSRRVGRRIRDEVSDRGRILDVGCADRSFLAALEALGSWELFGIENEGKPRFRSRACRARIGAGVEEHPNFVIARRLWDAIANVAFEELRALLSDKAVWRMYGESRLAGTYVGADAILEFMALVGELSDDLEADLLDVFVSDDGAVLRYRVRAVRGSQSLDIEHLFLIRIAEGRIVEGVFAPIDQHRYDRFFGPP